MVDVFIVSIPKVCSIFVARHFRNVLQVKKGMASMCCPSHITSLLRKLELQILKGCSRVALLTSPLCCGHVVGI